MTRRRVVTAAVSLAFVFVVVWAAHRPSGSSTGSTYDVTTDYVNGDGLCADDEIDVYGTRWFGQVVPPERLSRDHRYEGTLFVIDQGEGDGTRADASDLGRARFTTGSTTVTFTRWRPCV